MTRPISRDSIYRGPDLVLMDVMMPDMNGLEVVQRLKADPLMSQIPIVITTEIRNSFQVQMKKNVPSTISVGRMIGTTTSVRTCQRDAPSISAASRISRGNVLITEDRKIGAERALQHREHDDHRKLRVVEPDGLGHPVDRIDDRLCGTIVPSSSKARMAVEPRHAPDARAHRR